MEFIIYSLLIIAEIAGAVFVIWGFRHEQRFIDFEKRMVATIRARRAAKKEAQRTFNKSFNRSLRAISTKNATANTASKREVIKNA